MQWEVYNTGVNTPKKNMEIDEQLLADLDPNGPAILHLYSWSEPSATCGYFIKPEKILNLEALPDAGISLARRPTGGGVVFHLWDFAFSVLMPSESEGYSHNTLENYNYINSRVLKVIQEVMKESDLAHLLPQDPTPLDEMSKHFCMAKPTQYDVMLGTKKVAGAAQRKKTNGFLHQGTIALMQPDERLLQMVLKPNTKVLKGMLDSSYYLLDSLAKAHEQEVLKKQIEEKLIKEFTK